MARVPVGSSLLVPFLVGSGEPPAPPTEVIEETEDRAALIFATEAYESLSPWQDLDAENGFALRALIRAIATMFAQTEEAIRALGDGRGPWERLFNPDMAPLWLLPFIGQAVGVAVDTSRSEAAQVAQIKGEGAWHRGQPASIIEAVANTLSGGKSVRLVERASTPWKYIVITRPSETTNATATKDAAVGQKPGADILELEQSDLPLIDEMTREIDLMTEGTIDTMTLAQST